MKIWSIFRHEFDIGYDEQAAVVVVAETEAEARALAASSCGDEGPDVWLFAAKCVPLCADRAGIITRDFRAG